MRNIIFIVSLLVGPSFAYADSPPLPAQLSEDEQIAMCAETLPKQLACKKEFCAGMVKVRTNGNKNANVEAMEAACIKEIAVDASGDLAARKARCTKWIKSRPKVSATQVDAKEMTACWSKATCEEQIACWMPKMAKVMAS